MHDRLTVPGRTGVFHLTVGLRLFGGAAAAAIAVPIMLVAVRIPFDPSTSDAPPPIEAVGFVVAGVLAAAIAGAARVGAAIRSSTAGWVQIAFLTYLAGILFMPWVFGLNTKTEGYDIVATAMQFYGFLPFGFVFGVAQLLPIVAGAGVWTAVVRRLAPIVVATGDLDRARSGSHRDVRWSAIAVLATAIVVGLSFWLLTMALQQLGW